jgi:phosphohistidine swiveling domain-containing protein
MWVHLLADADRMCGGKAIGLARLIADGLPVPEGFVLSHRAFEHVVVGDHPLPRELEHDVLGRAAELGVVAVRSSATIEDSEAAAAAGVFSSRCAVPAASVWSAIRDVWSSALAPIATSYARHREPSNTAPAAIGVIVQRYIEGVRVTIYTRPPGSPSGDEVWLQREGVLSKLSRTTADRTVQLALAAERAIAAPAGADVELIISGDATWVVQARPIVHPVVVPRVPPPPILIAPLEADGRVWTWDVAHNPDPLSVAQTELIERVERANIAPWSLQVCAGYLYSAPRQHATIDAAADSDRLQAQVHHLEARVSQLLAATEPLELDDAIARYLRFYAIWANELSPLITAARAHVTDAAAGSRPSAVEVALLAVARGELDEAVVLDRLGRLSPAWDVAVPTYAERPGLLRDAIARARLSVGDVTASPTSEGAINVALDLAERDDAWFALAQWRMRESLMACGARLELRDDDVFWLKFDQLATGLDPEEAHRAAGAARSAANRAAGWAMPITVGGPPLAPRPPLRGLGTGPRVTGRVVRFGSLATAIAPGAGDIVVTRAVTPALAVLLIGCRGLISETGGPLDHGAALARELGIPHVVGCADAHARLADGMIVTMDPSAGLVEIMR